MIEKLGINCANIFTVELLKDRKSCLLTEACDGYYEIELSKEEVLELANDFKRLAELMEPQERVE